MMEKRHRCKLCFRNFANGRALGGHMRSHMMKFYAEEHAFDDFQSVHSYSSSDDEDEEEDEIPEESALLVEHDFAAAAADADSGESETDSFVKKVPISRRSKRVRKSRISDLGRFGFFHVKKPKLFESEYYNSPEEPMSSVSDTTPEEHLAHCLMMLSRDTWQREDEEEYSGEAKVNIIKTDNNKVVRGGKYRCEECNKLFRSYQALGGHRASHKKIKPYAPPPPRKVVSNAPPEKKVHECPFCQRIFSSGQALGGHKRTHFIGGAAGAVSSANVATAATFRQDKHKQSSRIGERLDIDLNLPAPVDDDDDVSQVAVSAVSDEEFVQ